MRRCPVTGRLALARLEAPGRGLADAGAALGGLEGAAAAGVDAAAAVLQEVELSDNALATLAPLAAARDLVWLAARGNRLTAALDFCPRDCAVEDDQQAWWSGGAGWLGSKLEYADLSDNEISDLSPVAKHMELRVLLLARNRVSKLCGLTGLHQLVRLDLRHNNLFSIAGLGELPALRELLLDSNQIDSLRGVENLSSLERLSCADNEIYNLEPLAACKRLAVLDLSGNRIRRFNQLLFLQDLELLDALDLHGNSLFGLRAPCSDEGSGAGGATSELPCDAEDYRKRVLFRVGQIAQLDGQPVTARDKVGARNYYGADREHREQVFAAHFPGEAFPSVVDACVDLELAGQRLVPETASEVVHTAVDQGVQVAANGTKYMSKRLVAGVLEEAVHSARKQQRET